MSSFARIVTDTVTDCSSKSKSDSGRATLVKLALNFTFAMPFLMNQAFTQTSDGLRDLGNPHAEQAYKSASLSPLEQALAFREKLNSTPLEQLKEEHTAALELIERKMLAIEDIEASLGQRIQVRDGYRVRLDVESAAEVAQLVSFVTTLGSLYALTLSTVAHPELHRIVKKNRDLPVRDMLKAIQVETSVSDHIDRRWIRASTIGSFGSLAVFLSSSYAIHRARTEEITLNEAEIKSLESSLATHRSILTDVKDFQLLLAQQIRLREQVAR